MMFSNETEQPYSRSCSHYDTVIDSTTATRVCRECALVLEENVNICFASTRCPPIYEDNKHDTGIGSYHDTQLSDKLCDICFRLNISSHLISDVIIRCNDVSNAIEKANGFSLATVAFCLYDVCKKNGCHRQMDVVSRNVGCTLRQIWLKEKEHGTTNIVDYTGIVVEFCYHLNVDRRKALKLMPLIHKCLDLYEAHPRTIIGACICLSLDIKVSRFCAMAHISNKSVYRFKKLIRANQSINI